MTRDILELKEKFEESTNRKGEDLAKDLQLYIDIFNVNLKDKAEIEQIIELLK